MSKASPSTSARRTFLKGAAAAGGVATVAVAGGAALTAGPEPQRLAEASEPEPSRGYRETDHVREYYRLAQL